MRNYVNIIWFGKSRSIPLRVYCNGKITTDDPNWDEEYTIVRRGECEYGLRNNGTKYLLIYDDELRQH